MINNVFFIVLGLGILIAGAQFLVKGASRFALALGIPPLIVGLTIVAFGTSGQHSILHFKSNRDRFR
jgi:cation:H+ antiporter